MEKMCFEVRKAITSDIEEIRLLARESFKMYAENAGITELVAPLNESYEDVKKDIETKEVFVALFNEKIIGSVRIEIKPDNTAYLSRFGVSALYQNNGVGKILMNAVDESMRELGITVYIFILHLECFHLLNFIMEEVFI